MCPFNWGEKLYVLFHRLERAVTRIYLRVDVGLWKDLEFLGRQNPKIKS